MMPITLPAETRIHFARGLSVSMRPDGTVSVHPVARSRTRRYASIIFAVTVAVAAGASVGMWTSDIRLPSAIAASAGARPEAATVRGEPPAPISVPMEHPAQRAPDPFGAD